MATKFTPYTDDLGVMHAIQVDDAIYLALDNAAIPPFATMVFYNDLAALQAGEAGTPELLPNTIQPRLMVVNTVFGQFTVICPLPFDSGNIYALEESEGVTVTVSLARIQGEANSDPEGVAP